MDEEIFHRALEIDVLARTLWGEAGWQGSALMHAVAHVVLNRVRAAEDFGRDWWGGTIIQVCQQPFQFRCWNANNRMHRKILRVRANNPYFAAARTLAAGALIGLGDDPTAGATHYHAAGAAPEWAAEQRPTAVINGVIFYQFLTL